MGEIFVEIELENIEDRNLARAGVRAEADVRRVTVRAVGRYGRDDVGAA